MRQFNLLWSLVTAVVFLLIVTPGQVQTVSSSKQPVQASGLPPGINAEEICADVLAGSACWLELGNKPGCYFWYSFTGEWNSFTKGNITATWSGACTGGLAEGYGEITWVWGTDQEYDARSTGRFEQGRMQGIWDEHYYDGAIVEEGPYVDGERHSRWVISEVFGAVVLTGEYINGKRHGHWVENFFNGVVMEGPYEGGNKHGEWVMRFPDGSMEEGPFIDDKKHGQWIERWADGTVVEKTYLTGEVLRQHVLPRPGKAGQAAVQDSDASALAGEMVSIPGGTFDMGDLSGEGDDDEKPVHMVTVPAFRMGKYEVTFAQWDACVADRGCYTPDDSGWGRGNRPVIHVSWEDAQRYIDWLNDKTDGNYRLPTEAEWEYAARAGSTTKYHFGDDWSQLCQYANHWDATFYSEFGIETEGCSDGVGDTTAVVGRYRPNSFGLYDIHGNVWEWVQDCWNESYAGAPTDGRAWTLGDCDLRVVRGGSFIHVPVDLRSAYRARFARSTRDSTKGFRLAQDE